MKFCPQSFLFFSDCYFFLGRLVFGKWEKLNWPRLLLPLLVCGTLLLIIGVGLLYSNTTRIQSFKKITERVQKIFLAEIARADKTIVNLN